MNFSGAGIAHHLHDLFGRGAAHDGIINQDHAFAFQDGAIGRMLARDRADAAALGRLDEGTSDIVAADDTKLERQVGLFSISDRCRNTAIGYGHDDIGVYLVITESGLEK